MQQILSFIGLAPPAVTATQAVRSGASPPGSPGLFGDLLFQAQPASLPTSSLPTVAVALVEAITTAAPADSTGTDAQAQTIDPLEQLLAVATSLTQQAQTLTLTAASPAAPTPRDASSSQTGPQIQPGTLPVTVSDPALAQFVQQAVLRFMAGTTALALQAPTQPFRDLVQLVVAAEGRGQGGEVSGAPSQQVLRPEQPEKPKLPDFQNPFEIQLKNLVRDFTTRKPEAPAPGATPVETEQVLRQVTSFVKVALDGMKSEVRMQLQPENLGPVTVRLMINDGVVRATLAAQDASVKNVLQANLDQLRTRLAEQGLRVEQVQVAVGGETAFGQSDQSDHGQPRQHGETTDRQPHWRQVQTNANATPQAEPRTFERIWRPRGTGMRIDSLA